MRHTEGKKNDVKIREFVTLWKTLFVDEGAAGKTKTLKEGKVRGKLKILL